ncbi:MAG TPA: porin [Gammaproteobacteria bacterium]|nr:porin [Gammaproteobacteria bacterium]
MKNALTAAIILAMTGGMTVPAFAGGADSTTIGGKIYADLTWLKQELDDQDTAASGYGLDVKRFYLSVDHGFDDVWSADLTTDFDYVSQDGKTQLFVKKAYIQAAFDKAATLRAGSADMPWIPFVEQVYGYRFVEKTITDRLGFANSADWGVHLLGKPHGSLSYQVSLVNGGGYKNPSRSDGMDIAARVGFEPIAGLTIAIGGYDGHRDKDFSDAPANHTATRYDALVAYVHPGFRFGAEYFRASNWDNVTTLTTDSADGYSIFASAAVARNLNVFARYDHASLSNDLNPSLEDKYYNVGVSFQARDNIEVALAYKRESKSDAQHSLKTGEIGVWTEVKF